MEASIGSPPSRSSMRSAEQQLTVKRRGETDAEKIPLRQLFQQSSKEESFHDEP
jgi:hypothetical protein